MYRFDDFKKWGGGGGDQHNSIQNNTKFSINDSISITEEFFDAKENFEDFDMDFSLSYPPL